jgi:parvulin-like peptidyl-prolyl isomerase
MRSIRLLLAPVSLALLAASCGSDSPSVPPSAIAVVGDRTISHSQFDALIAEARQSYAVQSRPFPRVGTSAYDRLKRLAVQLLVEQAELDQEAPKLGVHVDAGQVDRKLDELKEQSFGGSEQRYRARLRAAGMTDAQVRSALRAQLLVQAVRQSVVADVSVDAPSVQRYYEQHLQSYTRPRTRAVRHILVKTRAAAALIDARLAAGASFASLAARFSRDSRTRARGGLLTLVEDRTSPGLDGVAFGLATGQTSEPFRTAFGWELVQAVSAVTPARTTPFAAVRDGIRRRLLAQRRAESFQRWLAAVREKFEQRTAFSPGYQPAGAG